MQLLIQPAHHGEKNTTLEWHLNKEFESKLTPYFDHLVSLRYQYRIDNKQLKVSGHCDFKAHHKSTHVEVASFNHDDNSAISLAKQITKLIVEQIRSYTSK